MFLFVLTALAFFTSQTQESVAGQKPPKNCSVRLEYFYGATPEDMRYFKSIESNLLRIERLTSEEAKAQNQSVFDSLKNEALPKDSARKVSLSRSEIEAVYKEVLENPQVSESICQRYRGSPKRGFCFGHAMAAHFKALDVGLNNLSIRKLWAVGDLRPNQMYPGWLYHVTTIVRASDGEWYALDPYFGKVLNIQEWYQRVARFDFHSNSRLFATPAGRFQPEDSDQYQTQVMMHRSFYHFFEDLMESLKKERAEKKQKP